MNIHAEEIAIACNHIAIEADKEAPQILFLPRDVHPCVGLMHKLQIVRGNQCANPLQILFQRGAADVESLAEIVAPVRRIALQQLARDFADPRFCGITKHCTAIFKRVQKAEEAAAICHVQRNAMIRFCDKLRAVRPHHLIQPRNVVVDRSDGNPELLRQHLIGNKLILGHEQHQL